MYAQIKYGGKIYSVDLTKPVDISIAIRPGKRGVNAWGTGYPEFTPVTDSGFAGEVRKGGTVNFRDIYFNPHSHGTHTECLGHITHTIHAVNKAVKNYFFIAGLITILPEEQKRGKVITKSQILKAMGKKCPLPPHFPPEADPPLEEEGEGGQALIIRTLPNPPSKQKQNYSGTHPPFLDRDAANLLRKKNILHLLVDLPSVDAENDGGKMAAHRAFWGFPSAPRIRASITELVYIPSKIEDGTYLLNLMIAGFENDAAPSRPVLYALSEIK